MAAVPRWIITALGEIGQAEIAGVKANQRILKYLDTVHLEGSDEIAWCSAFVNWNMIQCGFTGTGKGNARSWLDWGKKLDAPQLGAIVVFDRPPLPWQGHVGFVLDWDIDYIILLGGNQGNRVSIKLEPKQKLLGLRWPGGN